MNNTTHLQLDCGIELAVLRLPTRRAEALDLRILAGTADEPADKLGLARLVEQTLDKGTALRDGRGLSDAFDEIGAVRGSGCGRETTSFSSLCLPEYFARNIELHAEFLRTPSLPEESCIVAIELARQELLSIEDDPQSLADKLIARQAYGPVLGRHSLGEKHTLEAITPDDFAAFWKGNYRTGRMLAAAAGPLDPDEVAAALERHFAGFGVARRDHRETRPIEFDAHATHHLKDTEQQHIVMAFPGVAVADRDYSVERILVGVLSGGMSARLFTEIREKQGLVYWVGAWKENPRGSGMLFVGASTTPQRCDQTYATLRRELQRVGEDVTAEEVERALAGICVRADIRGDMTRSRCGELVDDLLHYGQPVGWEAKRARLEAVRAADVKRFCGERVTGADFSVVTLGPRPPHEDGAKGEGTR